MAQTKFIIPLSNLNKNKERLVKYLTNWFKKNGSLYFEHGYIRPLLILNDENLYLYSINNKAEVLTIPYDRSKLSMVFNLNQLSLSQLQRLILIVNDYYLYCVNEA